MKRARIPFVNSKTVVPIVKFYLSNGKEAYGIVDTGSEDSYFDAEFVKENRALFKFHSSKSRISLVGVSNEAETPVMYCVTDISFGEDYYAQEEVPGMIISLYHISEALSKQENNKKISALFGGDILSRLDTVINYRTKSISMNQ